MTKAEYQGYLHSDHWKSKRNEALTHFKHRCVICHSKAKLQVHHLTYKNIGNESIRELIVACGDCHKLIHNIR